MTEEPPNLSFVRTGGHYPFRWWQRDDEATVGSGYETGRNWWDCAFEDGGPDGPRTWAEVFNEPHLMHVTLTEMPT